MSDTWNPDVDGFRKNRGQEEVFKFDSHAHAVTVIGEPHRMIHDGFMSNASGVAVGIANAAALELFIRLPAGTIRHVIQVEFALDDAPCTVEFFEGSTASADGTAVNIRNHNRIASDPTVDLMFEGPTLTGDGTLLLTRYIPSPASAGGQAAGQLVSGDDFEWILGHPTLERTYLWRVTNNSGGAITMGYHFNGYQIGYER